MEQGLRKFLLYPKKGQFFVYNILMFVHETKMFLNCLKAKYEDFKKSFSFDQVKNKVAHFRGLKEIFKKIQIFLMTILLEVKGGIWKFSKNILF